MVTAGAFAPFFITFRYIRTFGLKRSRKYVIINEKRKNKKAPREGRLIFLL